MQITQDSLETTIILGKAEVVGQRGRPNLRCIDSVKEAAAPCMQNLSKSVIVNSQSCHKFDNDLTAS